VYRLFQILLLCSIPFLSISQSITELNGQIKQYLLAKNEPATLACYKQILILDKNNIDALCGASFMCSRIGNREKDAAKKKSFFNTAKIFAQQALKINSNYSQANYVMAVAMGRIALISGSQDNGTTMMGFDANSKLHARKVYSGDGGICALSDIFSDVAFGSTSYRSDMARSVTNYPT
jgi:hypothetical protein